MASFDQILVVSDRESPVSDWAPLLRSAGAASVARAESPAGASAGTLVLWDAASLEAGSPAAVRRAVEEGARVACVGHPDDLELVLQLVKAGVCAFLDAPPRLPELEALICRADGRAAAPAKAAPAAFVLGTKGGCGTTTVAVNAACALARRGVRVALCDFSAGRGHACDQLRLAAAHTLGDAVDPGRPIDASFVETLLVRHDSGLKVLAAPREGQRIPDLSDRTRLARIFSLLRASHDFLVVDGGGADAETFAALSTDKDLFFPVLTPDLFSILGAGAVLKRLAENERASAASFVLNRCGMRHSVDTAEFLKRAGRPVAARFPNRYGACVEAAQAGRALVDADSRSDLSRAFHEWAAKLVPGEPARAAVPSRKGIFPCF